MTRILFIILITLAFNHDLKAQQFANIMSAYGIVNNNNPARLSLINVINRDKKLTIDGYFKVPFGTNNQFKAPLIGGGNIQFCLREEALFSVGGSYEQFGPLRNGNIYVNYAYVLHEERETFVSLGIGGVYLNQSLDIDYLRNIEDPSAFDNKFVEGLANGGGAKLGGYFYHKFHDSKLKLFGGLSGTYFFNSETTANDIALKKRAEVKVEMGLLVQNSIKNSAEINWGLLTEMQLNSVFQTYELKFQRYFDFMSDRARSFVTLGFVYNNYNSFETRQILLSIDSPIFFKGYNDTNDLSLGISCRFNFISEFKEYRSIWGVPFEFRVTKLFF